MLFKVAYDCCIIPVACRSLLDSITASILLQLQSVEQHHCLHVCDAGCKDPHYWLSFSCLQRGLYQMHFVWNKMTISVPV